MVSNVTAISYNESEILQRVQSSKILQLLLMLTNKLLKLSLHCTENQQMWKYKIKGKCTDTNPSIQGYVFWILFDLKLCNCNSNRNETPVRISIESFHVINTLKKELFLTFILNHNIEFDDSSYLQSTT